MAAFVSVIGLLVLVYVGICLFYFLFQERFIFVRFPLRKDYRFRFNIPVEERWIQRPDGAILNALHFPVDRPKGTVLYFHGNTGHLKRWGRRAERFTQLGFNVLMPDPRGYGKSCGRTSEFALIEDAKAWFVDAERSMSADRIAIYGCSLGCALAIPTATQHQPRLLLLETPFSNLAEVARSYLPILPYRWLLRYPFRNDETIGQLNCPVFIFHGKRDQVVPYASALRLYAAVPSAVEREFFTFQRGRHHDLYRFPEFWETVRRLLGRIC